jgi:hypothetical protein
MCGLDWRGSGQGQLENSCGCGKEPSCSITITTEWLHN